MRLAVALADRSVSLLLAFGLLLVGLAVVGIVTIQRAFGQHGTPANPYEETTAIVDTGPFRLSLNPIYINMAIIQAALGFLFNNMWILLMIFPAMIVIHNRVVLLEVAHLEAKFGDAYLDYKSRVGRWI